MSTELPYPQPYTHLENVDITPREIVSLGVQTVTGFMTTNVQRTQQEIRKTITTGCSSLDLLLEKSGVLSNSPQNLSLRNVLVNCVSEAATIESHLPQVSKSLEPKDGMSDTLDFLQEQPKSKRKRKSKLEMIELRAQGLAMPKRRKKDPCNTLESKLSSISSDIQPDMNVDNPDSHAAALLPDLEYDLDETTKIPFRSDSESDASDHNPDANSIQSPYDNVEDNAETVSKDQTAAAIGSKESTATQTIRHPALVDTQKMTSFGTNTLETKTTHATDDSAPSKSTEISADVDPMTVHRSDSTPQVLNSQPLQDTTESSHDVEHTESQQFLDVHAPRVEGTFVPATQEPDLMEAGQQIDELTKPNATEDETKSAILDNQIKAQNKLTRTTKDQKDEITGEHQLLQDSTSPERSFVTTQTTASQKEVKAEKRRVQQEQKMLAQRQLLSPRPAQVSDKLEKLRSIPKDRLKRAIARKQAAQQARNTELPEGSDSTPTIRDAESLISRPSTDRPSLSQPSPTPAHRLMRPRSSVKASS